MAASRTLSALLSAGGRWAGCAEADTALMCSEPSSLDVGSISAGVGVAGLSCALHLQGLASKGCALANRW